METLHVGVCQSGLLQDKYSTDQQRIMLIHPTRSGTYHFIRNASAPPTQETAVTSSRDEEQEEERGPLVVIPYVAGMSDIRHACRKFNIRVVFKSGRTLRSMLTKVKDTLPLSKQSNVVYRIPCSCGQVYIRETRRRLETILKEHRDACDRGMMEKSAVAEQSWPFWTTCSTFA